MRWRRRAVAGCADYWLQRPCRNPKASWVEQAAGFHGGTCVMFIQATMNQGNGTTTTNLKQTKNTFRYLRRLIVPVDKIAMDTTL